ncbi:class I SAM-dependent methyltransferase [Yimella sp. NH-Cas1]|uniref:class I SAM-dependent methyltransferase n=1 Tax=Yimella sp. NH-Cas1 TaxID=2917726 RepID=UPI001EFA548C|nr:class I SAM-dependent methyltransferase [Yimella sp. NH-Cas1]
MVDVGGGFGEQAIMLAREGFRVTVSDPDPDMLAMVKSRIQTLEEALASRVVLVPDDGRRLESLGAGECDAVLLHSVLMFFQDVRPVFEAASRVLKSTHDRDTLVDVAAEFGFVPDAEFVVRVFTDHLEDTDVPHDPAEMAALMELSALPVPGIRTARWRGSITWCYVEEDDASPPGHLPGIHGGRWCVTPTRHA